MAEVKHMLEMAAKAAGYFDKRYYPHPLWNPKVYIGDAIHLASILCLKIDIREDEVFVHNQQRPHSQYQDAYVKYDVYPVQAVCDAVLECAAKIGEATP